MTENDVNAAMREVRLALLEADVNYKVVKDFVGRVKARAIGAEVMESLTPAQQVVKIVNEELIELLGKPAPLNTSGQPPHVIMLVGLQGAGKTTMAAKLALRLRKNGQRPCWWRRTSIARRPSSSSRCWASRSTCPSSPVKARRRLPPTIAKNALCAWRAKRPTTWSSSTRLAACRSTMR